ncbi:hypothetical protein UFOVP1009_7 [uncultured Caudovirales phage]|uniref:Uncharacterized protein n=1 Tax=uncultured Caudovirales phage TaxID=2100421 RepID=A0A6J5Q939_9CAUD|nr:hypothetical protein UFOVP1009_7 [uncultured Caudovirales phage]
MQHADDFIANVLPKILKAGGVWDHKTMMQYSGKVRIKEVNYRIKHALGQKAVPQDIAFILAHFGHRVDGGIGHLFKTQRGLNILKSLGVLS